MSAYPSYFLLITKDGTRRIDKERFKKMEQMKEKLEVGGHVDDIVLSKLKAPFKNDEVEFRLAQCGESGGKVWAMCLAYISARAIQDRLDDVCGPENWKVTYEFISTNGVICNLSIKIRDQWITKQDGAEFTDIESFKGGISSALKRAGSAWGMGRYLYSLESAFAIIVEKNTNGAQYGKTKNGQSFYWVPPKLPDWALPVHSHGDAKPVATHTPPVVAPKVAVIVAPITPPKSPDPHSRGYRMTFGRFKDKTLGEVDPKLLCNYIDEIKAKSQGKKLSKVVLDFVNAAEIFLADCAPPPYGDLDEFERAYSEIPDPRMVK